MRKLMVIMKCIQRGARIYRNLKTEYIWGFLIIARMHLQKRANIILRWMVATTVLGSAIGVDLVETLRRHSFWETPKTLEAVNEFF